MSRDPGMNGLGRRQFVLRAGATVAAATAASGVLAACGGASKQGTLTSPGLDDAATQPPSDGGVPEIADKYKGKKIGYLAQDFRDPTQPEVARYMEEAADAAGLDWDVAAVDGKADPGAISQGLASFVTQRKDAIALGAVHPRLAVDAFRRAKDAGIPVFTTYAFAAGNEYVTADYSGDLQVDATWLGNYMFNWLTIVKKPRGDIKLALLDNQTLDVIKPRSVYVRGVLASGLYPRVKLVAEHEVDLADPINDARKAFSGIMRSNRDLDAVWCNLAPIPATVATEALAQNRGEISVFGHSASKPALDALRDENNPVQAIADQDIPYGSWKLVDLMLQHFKGEPINPLISWIDPVPVVVITKDANLPAEGQRATSRDGAWKRELLAHWGRTYAS
jgi:ABC-type sugar transport system substrate-binding protein